ncbi:MAG: hypothetical protein JW747_08465 [Candidatus Aminicenantes bacterium]|nr:hypothetical protein [Candidatus Aminicenantes bacterium]
MGRRVERSFRRAGRSAAEAAKGHGVGLFDLAFDALIIDDIGCVQRERVETPAAKRGEFKAWAGRGSRFLTNPGAMFFSADRKYAGLSFKPGKRAVA